MIIELWKTRKIKELKGQIKLKQSLVREYYASLKQIENPTFKDFHELNIKYGNIKMHRFNIEYYYNLISNIRNNMWETEKDFKNRYGDKEKFISCNKTIK